MKLDPAQSQIVVPQLWTLHVDFCCPSWEIYGPLSRGFLSRFVGERKRLTRQWQPKSKSLSSICEVYFSLNLPPVFSKRSCLSEHDPRDRNVSSSFSEQSLNHQYFWTRYLIHPPSLKIIQKNTNRDNFQVTILKVHVPITFRNMSMYVFFYSTKFHLNLHMSFNSVNSC